MTNNAKLHSVPPHSCLKRQFLVKDDSFCRVAAPLTVYGQRPHPSTYRRNEARQISKPVDDPLLQTFAVQDLLVSAQKILSHPSNGMREFVQQLIDRQPAVLESDKAEKGTSTASEAKLSQLACPRSGFAGPFFFLPWASRGAQPTRQHPAVAKHEPLCPNQAINHHTVRYLLVELVYAVLQAT